MKKNIYLILLISSLLYQTLSYSMDRQINTISKPNSFAWVDDKTIAITNTDECYLLDLQKNNQFTTLGTSDTAIDCVFDNNQKILLSKIWPTDKTIQFVIYDLTTKDEILPRLSKNCFSYFVLTDKLILASHSTDDKPYTITDINNQEYALPINYDAIRPVASSRHNLLFTPCHTEHPPLTQQKWISVNLEFPTKPKIKEICPTFLKDNPKNVSTAFYSHDGTCIAFKTVPYEGNFSYPWFIYNFIIDTISKPIKCLALTISPNNSTAAYLSPNDSIVFIDIKLDQTICSLSLEKKSYSSGRLNFSPDGTQPEIPANTFFALSIYYL